LRELALRKLFTTDRADILRELGEADTILSEWVAHSQRQIAKAPLHQRLTGEDLTLHVKWELKRERFCHLYQHRIRDLIQLFGPRECGQQRVKVTAPVALVLSKSDQIHLRGMGVMWEE
jgi:hypothetical protein